MKRCALYIRVSTEEQHINGLSLPAQLSDLEHYAKTMDYKVVGIYADEGISARKSMKKRTDLMRLLEDVKKDKIDMILVTKLDRWFRNIKDYNITEEILLAHNCHWKTIFENYDSSTANGQMVINIMLSVNQAECDRTSERIKAVFDYKRRMGEHINGRPPYGYKIVDNKPVKDEKTQAVVEDYFQQYFTTFSKRKTIEYIVNKYGKSGPSTQMMDKMLKKEVYCGIRGDDAHYCEPYITQEQYELLKTVCSSKTYAFSNEPYIFSQLIKCPHCGATMTGFIKKHKCKDGSVSMYKRYRCCRKYDFEHPSGACVTESVVEDYMIANVCKKLNSVLFHFSSNRSKTIPYVDNAAKIRAEINRLNLQFQKGRIDEDYYDRQYDILEKKLKDSIKKNTETIDDYAHIVKQFSGEWIEVYNKLDAEHKNAFWKRTIKEISIDKDSHKISGFKFLIHGCSK